MVYFLFYLYNFIVAFSNSRYLYFFVTFGVFILVFGFRYEVGADWISYKENFYDTSVFDFEFGFELLNYIIYNLTNNFQFLILLIFLILVVSYFYNIDYFTPNRNIAIMAWLGIGFLSFGVLRQVIAISIFFYSLRFVQDNVKKYLILILIASTFHNSAIGLIPLIFFIRKKISIKKSLIIIFISFFIYLLGLDTFILELLSNLPIIGEKINVYLYKEGIFSEELGLGVRFIEAFILYIICTINKKKLEKKYSYFNIFYNLLLLYLIFYLCFNDVSTIAARFIKYFEIGHIILFSYLVGLISNKNLKMIFILILFLYFGLRYYMTLIGGFSLQENIDIFFPYKNYFNQLLFF